MKSVYRVTGFSIAALILMALVLVSCAGQRQAVVCDEMEYRLNSMTYSPDQRYYAEEELRACREEEAQKKAESAATRKSIYDRFASSENTRAGTVDSTGMVRDSSETPDVSVSELMGDSSGQTTTSIYDRYGAVGGENPADSGVAEQPAEATADNAVESVDENSTAVEQQ